MLLAIDQFGSRLNKRMKLILQTLQIFFHIVGEKIVEVNLWQSIDKAFAASTFHVNITQHAFLEEVPLTDGQNLDDKKVTST